MENSTEVPQKKKQNKTKTKTELPNYPTILLLIIYPEKTLIENDTCTPVFIAPLFKTLKTTQFSSVAQSHPTLCSPMDCVCQASLSITNSRSLLKITSIESVMPSNYLILCHPLLLLPSIFPSIKVFFEWIRSRHQVTKVLEILLQFFQWIFRTDFLEDWLISFQSNGLWRVFSNTTVPKHQFFSTHPSICSNSHSCTWLLEKQQLWQDETLPAK